MSKRAFSFAIARTEAAALLIEQAVASDNAAAVTAAKRWCARDLASLVEGDANHRSGSMLLADGNHQS
jgi:hypothetical protein